MCMHRAHVCEGACASAHVVTHSIILDGFSSNLMLQIITRYMGYILIMFKHRVQAYVCERACVSACVIKRSLILNGFSPNLVGTYNESPEVN
jgi:hypothetical protein